MAGLFRNDPETREGKYPVVLRRDGMVPEWDWFILGQFDEAAIAALNAYADKAEELGWDPQYVADLRAMAKKWSFDQFEEREFKLRLRQSARYADDPGNFTLREARPPSNPDGARHRQDDPDVLSFPRSLAAFKARLLGQPEPPLDGENGKSA